MDIAITLPNPPYPECSKCLPPVVTQTEVAYRVGTLVPKLTMNSNGTPKVFWQCSQCGHKV